MAAVREFFHCLRAALREVFRPEPFIDPDPSVDRRGHSCPDRIHPGQSTRSEVSSMRRTWDW